MPNDFLAMIALYFINSTSIESPQFCSILNSGFEFSSISMFSLDSSTNMSFKPMSSSNVSLSALFHLSFWIATLLFIKQCVLKAKLLYQPVEDQLSSLLKLLIPSSSAFWQEVTMSLDSQFIVIKTINAIIHAL